MSLHLLRYVVVLSYPIFIFNAFAADPPCIAQANEKKVEGAARISFLKTFEQQAKIGCETVAKMLVEN
jgi:hypothetical protein